MLYLSTRGHAERKRFCEILLEGLAPDGGLYLPEHYPQVDDAALTRLRSAMRGNKLPALAQALKTRKPPFTSTHEESHEHA